MAILLQFKLSTALWLGVSAVLSAYSLSFMQQVKTTELVLVASGTARALDEIAQACVATGAEIAFRPPLPAGWFAHVEGRSLTVASPYGSYSLSLGHAYERVQLRAGEAYIIAAEGDRLVIRRWT
jgi:hypothetical protein